MVGIYGAGVDMLEQILQFAVSVLAIVGVVLNNHRLRWCFVLWILSNTGTAFFHFAAHQWGLLFRDVIFLILAIQGWFLWKNN